MNDFWSFARDVLERERESMHSSWQKALCLCQLLLAFISRHKRLFFNFQLDKSYLKLMCLTGAF